MFLGSFPVPSPEDEPPAFSRRHKIQSVFWPLMVGNRGKCDGERVRNDYQCKLDGDFSTGDVVAACLNVISSMESSMCYVGMLLLLCFSHRHLFYIQIYLPNLQHIRVCGSVFPK